MYEVFSLKILFSQNRIDWEIVLKYAFIDCFGKLLNFFLQNIETLILCLKWRMPLLKASTS